MLHEITYVAQRDPRTKSTSVQSFANCCENCKLHQNTNTELRLFKILCEEMDFEYSVLLLHTVAQWLQSLGGSQSRI